MAFERKWQRVGPVLLTANGTSTGEVFLSSTSGFKVKQEVLLRSSTQTNLRLEVKRVLSDTVLLVGEKGRPIDAYSDISAFLISDGASLEAPEQNRPAIPDKEFERAAYEEEPTVAKRVVLVDEFGSKITEENPLPTSATLSGNITIGTDGYDLTDPDSINVTGSENGQKTGIKHSLRVDSDLDLRVGISDGVNKAEVDENGRLRVYDEVLGSKLDSIITVVEDKSNLILGTDDGTINGTPAVFVNNLRLQVLAAENREQEIVYQDFGTKNQRITEINYTSTLFPGVTVKKILQYTLVGSRYRRDLITWSII